MSKDELKKEFLEILKANPNMNQIDVMMKVMQARPEIEKSINHSMRIKEGIRRSKLNK